MLRPAEPDDAAELAAVYLVSRTAAPMPPPPGPLVVRASDEVWVAELDDGLPRGVVGYLRLTPTWLDDLYVLPEHAGAGIGTALLDLAKALRPDGFGLYVFEPNTPARAFYARRGLVEVRRSGGRENPEGVPDVELWWSGG